MEEGQLEEDQPWMTSLYPTPVNSYYEIPGLGIVASGVLD